MSMGKHSAQHGGMWRAVWRNRSKVAAVAILALPLVARYVPGFPVGETVSVLRMFLGA